MSELDPAREDVWLTADMNPDDPGSQGYAQPRDEVMPDGVRAVQRNGDFQTVYFTDGSSVYGGSDQSRRRPTSRR